MQTWKMLPVTLQDPDYRWLGDGKARFLMQVSTMSGAGTPLQSVAFCASMHMPVAPKVQGYKLQRVVIGEMTVLPAATRFILICIRQMLTSALQGTCWCAMHGT